LFKSVYLARLQQISDSVEDEEASMSMGANKKFPLNGNMYDDNLIVANPRVVDIEWQTNYVLATKNVNKLMDQRFTIILSVLSQGDF
jgi:hypothetical protein